jgi:RND family efflux transporter MFP subunit
MESTDLELQEQEALTAARAAELAELQTPRKEDVEEAQARVQALQVTLSNAERRLEELRALSRRGAATQSELRDAEDAFDSAEQTLLAARAACQRTASGAREEQKLQAQSMLESQQKHVEYLRAEREKRLTKAPFDGFVVEEHTYVGQWLSRGAPVLTLARLDEVEVEVQIDQQYIDQVSPGREVSLRISGSGVSAGERAADGVREWTGQVAAVVPRSNWEKGSRSFPVIIRVRNQIDLSTSPPTPALREGMMAEAAFRGVSVKALLVPKDAVVRTSRGAFVFVVNPVEEGKPLSVRQVMVTLGLGTGLWIQVQGESLAAGQQVVTEGAERLRAFQTVTVLAAAAEGAAAASGGGAAGR